MIRYKKYQVTGENSPLKGLWYARPVIEETFDIEKLAKHMSNHNTPYSSGVIKGVLTDMVSCTKELILDGKNEKWTTSPFSPWELSARKAHNPLPTSHWPTT